jgi:predicted DNA-binding transcriptional regulator YafY
MDAPLKYNAKRRGYYYEDEAFVIPNIYINEDIKKMLGFLAYNYSNRFQTPKAVQMAKLFKKLTDGDEKDADVPVFDLEKPEVQTYYNIYNAIRNKCKLKLIYRDAHRGSTELVIHPYKVFHKYRADYLACCDESGEIITLRLDRITETWIMDEKFEITSGFDESRYNSFIKRDPYTARIKFTKEPVFQNTKGISLKQIEGFVYDIEFFEIEDFINQLSNMDYWEIIYSPKWLKQRLKERCLKILDKLEL